MAGADAWIPVFTGMTRGGVTGCGGDGGGVAGMAGGNRVDSRFHGNDKGGSDGVWRGWRGVAGCGEDGGGNRVDSRFHGNDKGGNDGVWRE